MVSPGEGPPRRSLHSHSHSTGSLPNGRKRVGFTVGETSREQARASPSRPDENAEGYFPPVDELRPELSHDELSEKIHEAFGEPYLPKPRPAIRKTERTPPPYTIQEESEDEVKQRSGLEAQKRAAQLSKSVGTYSASAPGSRRNSNEKLMGGGSSGITSLPNVSRESLEEASTDDDEDGETSADKTEFLKEAGKLLRQHTRKGHIRASEDFYHSDATPLPSGQVSPVEFDVDEHVPKPPKFRTSVLGTLLKATNSFQAPSTPGPSLRSPVKEKKTGGHKRNWSSGSMGYSDTSTLNSPLPSPSLDPGRPRPWYTRSANSSTHSISRLIDSSSRLAVPGQKDMSDEIKHTARSKRAEMGKRTMSSSSLASLSTAFKAKKAARDEQHRIKIHLAGTLARQNYLRKLCRALMMYGAPTHRLEEYMNMSARVLEIEAQFLYMPGCMIMAFDDSSVHTSEVKLVRTHQGVDLGRLQDVHEIYKDVVHDRIGVDEASPRLQEIMDRKEKYNKWVRVPIYGLASAMVGPFAFEARPIDLPFCFMLGCILGWLQLVVAPRNELISNVFEIAAAVITSFIARGLGSITRNGSPMFCFSAMAQSSIALILPGFTVLSASLELQSRHMVAGSVRMVYAIIYSLFLGFGITIGTVIYGMMDKNATSETHCKNTLDSRYNYLFVLGFSLCLTFINQAKWKQVPAMVVIALAGYAVSFNSSQYFRGNSQVSSTLGALAIGFTANLHARFGRHIENWWLDFYESSVRPRMVRLRKRWLRRSHGAHKKQWLSARSMEEAKPSHSRDSSSHSEPYIPRTRKIGFGLAAAAMLPAIFVQVPSGLSVGGSLVSGINSADQITRNGTGVTTASGSDASSGNPINSVALQVGYSVIQVAIGITVGLFLSALLVYPFGKRRSGLFSF